MHIDIDIIAYAIIALLLLGRLWSVFGTRNDNEPQRPNPFAQPAPPPVVEAAPALPPAARLLPSGPPPASLAGGLAQVQAVDPSFDEKRFLQERRDVFTAIIGAYADGNLSSISEFLSPTIFAQFQNALAKREQDGHKAQTRLSQIKDVEVTQARAEDKRAYVTVKFVSDQENLLRDASGTIIGGEAGRFEEVTDIWVFMRDTAQPESKWVVVETRG